MKLSTIVAIFGLAIAGVAIAQEQSTFRTADELKSILETPAALFLLMLAASFVGALKQIVLAKQQGSTMSVGKYLAYWPETIATILGNGIAFAVLILTDQLNFASALGIGYGVNSAVDLMRPSSGRSGAIAAQTSGGT